MPQTTIDLERLPRHIAIIMDGNGRWAQKHGLPPQEKHEPGAKSVRAAIKACRELEGIEYLTLYAWSTENWRRSKEEQDNIFRLLSKYIAAEIDVIHEQNIRVTAMGRLEDLPLRAREDMRSAVEKTRRNTAMTVNVALNYGGRRELADAARAIAAAVEAGKLAPEQVDEDCFAQHLYCPGMPDPDLLIRTSGELRISNFMLWQLSYAEIVVLPTLWPDFRRRHLLRAIAAYQKRQRRFGGRV